ncbi:MAG: ornithine carbamoyltransferase [Nitrospirae bacterium]|nr:ornithine carbamoyltransferase [Nitrospirota bacterium]MBF0541959.1 ornithine carbamoyltransferase [Nitrospirota bacterium]
MKSLGKGFDPFQKTHKRDFLTVSDFTLVEITDLIDQAISLKKSQSGNDYAPLRGKGIGLIFEEISTRTRVSFEVAVYQLHGQPVFLTPTDIQLSRGETIADTARVLSRYLDGIVLRTYKHSRVEEFAEASTIPVINGLTDKHHPCQALADMMTIKEKKGRFKGVKLAYIGDGNNVANSLIEISSILGVEISIACPTGFEPDAEVIEKSRKINGSCINILHDPKEAAKDADVLYTDVWISMSEKGTQHDNKRAKFKGFQINDELIRLAKQDVIALHCLPAHRGEEITDSVMDGPHSAVFDLAENRLHTQKALLAKLIKNG